MRASLIVLLCECLSHCSLSADPVRRKTPHPITYFFIKVQLSYSVTLVLAVQYSDSTFISLTM